MEGDAAMVVTGAESVTARTMGLAQRIAAGDARRPDFGAEDALVDVGLSSLDLVNLMVAVEAEFDILIPPTLLNPKNFHSIGAIARMVESVRAGQAA
ncbi:phosphopantetheine-binding protein [Methylobacterium amylolyticum]|uniref:phosphopantetheine-binding protein n=1 Tax=Methylobacterium sp. NEAU 140 TaxID=3064945 RepID=UPI002733903E|nr:phosphopantetheine-binding protein [Methylobacterium sp. NEAU 140]